MLLLAVRRQCGQSIGSSSGWVEDSCEDGGVTDINQQKIRFQYSSAVFNNEGRKILESIDALSFSAIDTAKIALYAKILDSITKNRGNQHERELSLRCNKYSSTR